MEKKDRVLWVDGIKGFSCILILVHHYFLAKFPASYYGTAKETLCNGIDTYLAQSVLSFFMNGNFFVHLYVLITGYVTAYQIKKMHDFQDKFFSFSIKRYLKLSFPLFVFCFIMWIETLVTGVQNEKITLLNVFKSGMVKILYFGDVDFGAHLWMLNYTFIGGFAVSIVSLSSSQFSDLKMNILNLIIIFTILLQIRIARGGAGLGLILYATCFAGALAYFFINWIKEFEVRYKVLLFSFIFVVSIFFGAYPTGVIPTNYYRFFRLPIFSSLSPFFWHFISAFLFFISISQVGFLQVFWELPFNQKLAKYSYAFYIFHGVGIELSSMVFDKISSSNYVMFALLQLPVAVIFTLVIAFFVQNIVYKPYNNFVNGLVDKFFGKLKPLTDLR